MKNKGFTVLIVLIGLVALGAVYAGTRPEAMTREEKNKLLVEVAIGAMNAGDWESMAELYSPRYVQHRPGNTKTTNWADFELGCRNIKRLLPTLRYEIEDIIAEGDKVAVRMKAIVTYKQEHHFSKTTEHKIEFTEMDMFRIEGKRIVEEWCELDTADHKDKLWKLKNVKTWK